MLLPSKDYIKRFCTPNDKYFVDEDEVERYIAFFSTYLSHTKGALGGTPLILNDWQKQVLIRPLVGMKKKETGYRRYTKAYISIARKNAKSTFSAGLGNAFMCLEAEYGGEIYVCAGDREQANIVFSMAKGMVENSPTLSRMCRVYSKEILYPRTQTIFKSLSADAFTKHGHNCSVCIFDELHVQPNRELWDVMITSMVAREQPLMLALTTAGNNYESICWEQYSEAKEVLFGESRIEDLLPVIYELSPDEDYTLEKNWSIPNPNLGVKGGVRLDFLRSSFESAKNNASKINTFRRLHLNQWTSTEEGWIPIDIWNACSNKGSSVVDLIEDRSPCYVGLDLAAKRDFVAASFFFPPHENRKHSVIFPLFWLPKETLKDREKDLKVKIEAWAKEGYVYLIEGTRIDEREVYEGIMRWVSRFNFKHMGFDTWHATQIINEIEERLGEDSVIEVNQTHKFLSDPCRELEALVYDNNLDHYNNPVLSYMVGNVILIQDINGNWRPSKKRSKHIDGVMATLNALYVALKDLEDPESIYERIDPMELSIGNI